MTDRRRQVIDAAMSLFIAVPTLIAVITIVLGLRPDLEAALYRTIVVLLLVGAGGTLLELVYSQRRPQVPSGAEVATAATRASNG